MAHGTTEWEELSREVGEALSTRPDVLDRVRGDGSHLRGSPGGVLTPRTPSEIVLAIRWARRHRVPVVGRGGGTSLDGESVPPPGALVVDFSRWDRVVEIEPDDRLVRVQPGVVNRQLQEALRPHGLFFPPNPGSWRSSTIGGNASTNASGPRSLRYGPTRRWVRGWQAVLGSGEELRQERRAPKRSAGPDLLGLLVGSEGTLGLFTELLLEVAPLPDRRQAVVVPVPSVAAAMHTAQTLLRRDPQGLPLSALEFVDATVADLLHAIPPGRLPAGRPLILIELESTDRSADVDLESLLGRLARDGLEGEAISFPNADDLWTLRGESGLALDRKFGERIREDIAVPLSRVVDLARTIDEIAGRHRVPVHTFGHLGEGSLHPNFVVDPDSPGSEEIRAELFRAVAAMGGTISGEHGIGVLKAPYLELELGAQGVELLRGIKRLFDPDGILNPGKLFPREPSSVSPPAVGPPSPSPSGGAGGRTAKE
jgi:FAD/FMN-containing dehydrogenase